MQNFSFFLILASFFVLNADAQNWIPNLNENPNFFEIQRDFHEYWKGKKIEKGKGYKQFKRWEQYWQHRVRPDGSFYPAGISMDNYNEYLRIAGTKNKSHRSPTISTWESLGPSSTTGGYAGTGRINSLAFHPTNSNIIYAGAAGGGLWQSNNGGTSWFTNTDNIATLGVSAILIDPTNPSIIYIGTGDADGGDNYSVGVLKSIDGGATFNTTGLNWSITNFRLVRRLIFDPDNNSILLAATSDGIYRTTDAGTTWTQVQSGNYQDIEAKPTTGANIFYACSGNTIYRSTNDGVTWTSIQSISNTNRIALAVTPANNAYVYALCSRNDDSGFRALYRSTDSGQTYNVRSTTPNILGWESDGSDSGGQGWYDLVIAADPLNAETIHTGGVNHWKSTDGGVNWTIKSHWSGNGAIEVHADKHALEWQNNTTLWEGNDGGVYKTTNGGDGWIHLGSGIVNSQMYKLGVSQTDAKVITGLQDNGTKYKNNSGNWTDHIGGDGMECAIKQNNSNTMYASIYFGEFFRNTNGGSGSWDDITQSIPGDGNWITPFVINPINNNSLYIGYSQIYKSTNQGNSWNSIGNFSNGNNLDFIAVAPSDTSVIYAGRWNGLWRTTNNGSSWNTMTVPADGNNNSYSISMIAVHESNPNTIWAVCQNYNSGNKVFKSTNGGSTWTNISGSLPNIPANCITYVNGSNEGLYIGMDVGVYYRDNNTNAWELINDGLPNVEITELEINYFENKIYASTYGRGLWSLDLSNSCPKPSNLTLASVAPFAATFTWNNNVLPANGYEWGLVTTQNPPSTFTTTTATSVQVTGLTNNQQYYFYVRAKCSVSDSSTWSFFPFKHNYQCSGNTYDSGGASNEYSDLEDIVTTICPSNTDAAVKLTFSSFAVETGWDALYIHNGKDINSPLFSSSNPATQAGFPAGGYYGFSIIGPFTSTDTSGCLTLHFLSDASVTENGWNAAVSCTTSCNPNGVTNTNDTGWGSLRRAVECASNNQTLSISPNLTGQVINVNTPIVINKNISILQSPSTYFKVKSNSTNSAFSINTGNTFSISNIEIYGGTGSIGRAIQNNGTLNMTNIKVFEDAAAPTTGSLIRNQGIINLFGNNEIND